MNSHVKFDMLQNTPPANPYSFADFLHSVNGNTLLQLPRPKHMGLSLFLSSSHTPVAIHQQYCSSPIGLFRRPLLSTSVTTALGQTASISAYVIAINVPLCPPCTFPINSLHSSQSELLKTYTGSCYSPAWNFQWLPSHPEKSTKSLRFPPAVTLSSKWYCGCLSLIKVGFTLFWIDPFPAASCGENIGNWTQSILSESKWLNQNMSKYLLKTNKK